MITDNYHHINIKQIIKEIMLTTSDYRKQKDLKNP